MSMRPRRAVALLVPLFLLLLLSAAGAAGQDAPSEDTKDVAALLAAKGRNGALLEYNMLTDWQGLLLRQLRTGDFPMDGVTEIIDAVDVLLDRIGKIETVVVEKLEELKGNDVKDELNNILKGDLKDEELLTLLHDSRSKVRKARAKVEEAAVLVSNDVGKLVGLMDDVRGKLPARMVDREAATGTYISVITHVLGVSDLVERCERTRFESECDDKNHCQNGGTCIPTMNGPLCHCTRGFEGDKCEQESNFCKNVECMNGGTCQNGVHAHFECVCASGFVGYKCEFNADDCRDNPCKNGGECVDGVDSFVCLCRPGFNGDTCENNIDECAGSPCQNGADCIDGVDGYRCKCLPGFDGQDCEENIDDCSPDPCFNDGKCKDLVDGFECECAPGWEGRTCRVDSDECDPNPCQNGGMCIDMVNGFKCRCEPGFRGEKCSVNINECEGNPCQHGGTCTDGIDSFVCECAPGYEGANCERNIDECKANPCENGATCLDGVNSFTCICPDGFEGDACEINIDECASNPCVHGVCEDGRNDFNCDCEDGYTGKKCDVNIDECEGVICMHGGTCVDGIDSFKCECKDGYHGTYCEANKDECAGAPCKNGGRCHDGINSYTCTCRPGFKGTNCEIDIDECAPSPCKNGATCHDKHNAYHCECAPGFQGTNCELNIDECAVAPCENGGQCIDGVNSYLCKCADGFSGPRCATDKDECLAQPCKNGGKCVDGVNSFVCECPKSHKGKTCETLRNLCVEQGVNCANGGSCSSEGGLSWKCTCKPGFRGRLCQVNIDECASNPCKNGGRCLDGVNDYQCKCPAGFEGKNCEANIDECKQNQCKNGAKCHDEVNGYRCECLKGYSGTYCERSPWLSFGDTHSWEWAHNYCVGKGQRLCSVQELCPGGERKYFIDPALGSKYVASADYHNSWVAIGGDNSHLCKTHKEIHNSYPSWGASTQRVKEKSFGLCCPSGCPADMTMKISGQTYGKNGAACQPWEWYSRNPWPIASSSGYRAHYTERKIAGPLCRTYRGRKEPGCVTSRGFSDCAPKCGALRVCEAPISPCKYGGKCVTLGTDPGFRCDCTKDWTGSFCSISKHLVEQRAFSVYNVGWYTNNDVVKYNSGYMVRYLNGRQKDYSVIMEARGWWWECFELSGYMIPGRYFAWDGISMGMGCWGDRTVWNVHHQIHRQYYRRGSLPRTNRLPYFTFYRVDYRGTNAYGYENDRHLFTWHNPWYYHPWHGYWGIPQGCIHLFIRSIYYVPNYTGSSVHPLVPMMEERRKNGYP